MKQIIFLSLLGVLLTGCRTKSYMPVTQQSYDSIRTEVRTETVYVKDTAYVEIPKQTAEAILPDTMKSSLENDYAFSDAWVTPDGMLHHTLETKPQDLEIEFDKLVQRTDSTTTQTGTKTEVRTVEVERELTWWEQGQIYGFRVLAVLMVVWLIWRYRSKITNLIRKLI